jgi:hypothetical protein
MSKLLVVTCAVAALAACKGNEGGGSSTGGAGTGTAKPAPPKQPSAKCQAAADNLVALNGSDTTGPDAPTIKAECEELLLTDAEAECLANAQDKLQAVMCPRPLTPELRESEEILGLGPCRPVLVVAHLAERQKMQQLFQAAQMGQLDEAQLERAAKMFEAVRTELGASCRNDDWGADARTCFVTQDPREAMGCIDKVPVAILEKIDRRIKQRLAKEEGFEMPEDPNAEPLEDATGVAACDGYLRARRDFDRCEALPDSAKKSILGIVAPLEKPWRGLPEGAVAATGDAFEALCDQATEQLAQLAESVGCL